MEGTHQTEVSGRRRVVLIEVDGGVAEVGYVPPGVECVIYDHDDKKEEGQGHEERESGADEARCKARAISEGLPEGIGVKTGGRKTGRDDEYGEKPMTPAGALEAAFAAELNRTLADIAGDGATFEFDEDENEEGRFLRAVEEYETPNLAIKLEITTVPDAVPDAVPGSSPLPGEED